MASNHRKQDTNNKNQEKVSDSSLLGQFYISFFML